MSSNHEIDKFGNKWRYNEQGRLHRDSDLPAVEFTDGSKMWYKNGKSHREQDKPAIERADSTKEWFKNGKHLSHQEVEALKRKWSAIRNRDTDALAQELLNEL